MLNHIQTALGIPKDSISSLNALEAIPAEIVEAGNSDLFALAFSFNAVHGRPLTLSDRRNYAAHILKAEPALSDREVGRRCGLMQPTIAKVRRDLEQSTSIPVVTERVGRDGNTYSAVSKKAATVSLVDVLANLVSPVERVQQRKLAGYFGSVADLLEQQDNLKGFETIDDAAGACLAVLGASEAAELGNRLGWYCQNILKIAQALGFKEEPEA